MSFWGHLDDLRRCVVSIAWAVGGAFIILFSFTLRPFELRGVTLYYPYPSIMENIATQFFFRLKTDLLPPDVKLIQMGPGDSVIAQIQVALFLSVVIAMPVIIHQIWKFVSPALRRNEKRLSGRYVAPALTLFIAGCLFSYFIVTPMVLKFLYMYAGIMGVEKTITIDSFLSFAVLFIIVFGVIFELPIFMVGLSTLDIVKAKSWGSWWRYAAIAALVIGAVITPDGSGVTMFFVAGPIMVLYTIGYGAAVVAARKKGAGKTALPGREKP